MHLGIGNRSRSGSLQCSDFERSLSESPGLLEIKPDLKQIKTKRSPLDHLISLNRKHSKEFRPPKAENPTANRHDFFDRRIARERKAFIRMIAKGLLITSVAILPIMSIYWGSLFSLGRHVNQLKGMVIDYDQGTIGSAVRQAFLSSTGAPEQIGWTIAGTSQFSTVDQASQTVLEEDYWVVVVVNSNVTQRLQEVVAAGGGTYNSTSVVSIYASEARNENCYSEFLVPQINSAMRLAQNTFTSSHIISLSTLPTVQLSSLMKSTPQAVYLPLDFQIINVRPFDEPVAAAPNFIGLIYLLIIAHISMMINSRAQMLSGIYKKLSLRSLLKLRVIIPGIMYTCLSLVYCLISVIFQVPFTRFFGFGGFLIFWVMSFLAMSALGLVLESMTTFLTARFAPYFLTFWIIMNATVSVLPIQMLPPIYAYGYATPFYNVSRTVRAIVFNTKNEIGINMGIQLVWIIIGSIMITWSQIRQRKKEELLDRESF